MKEWFAQFFGLSGIIKTFERTLVKLERFERRSTDTIVDTSERIIVLAEQRARVEEDRARARKIARNVAQLIAAE